MCTLCAAAAAVAAVAGKVVTSLDLHMPSRLLIVRYGHGIGLDELRLAHATEYGDPTVVQATFADGHVVIINHVENPAIWHVSYALLCKKHIVQSVVERDLDALTAVLADGGKQASHAHPF